MSENSYSASDITVLEGLEAVRKRPGMYIGSTGPRGLHHLVYEVVDNGVDEALAGYATQIDITILKDNGIRVEDNGRGIPVEMHPTEKKSTLEVVMTILHAGGKFGGGGYSVSGGLHGVGISVVNALSKRVETKVMRDGYIWTQTYSNGGQPDGEIQKGEATEKTGTIQTFWADGDIFETTEYDFETLNKRFQQMAFLNKGLKITLKDERGEENKYVEYCYKDGLIDYIKFLNKQKQNDIINDIIYFETEDKEKKLSAEIALQWTNAYSQNIYTYANTISTIEGGTHEEGFRTALTSLINKYAREKALLKEKDDNLTGDDIREGLTAIISIKLSEPQFEGQTKTKLGNTEARTFIQKITNEFLADWLDKNPKAAKEIIKKAIGAATARLAARKAREAVRRKNILETASMPGKLRDCTSKDPFESEIFIVEGDSAGGSAVRGRQTETQAILPLRGKILNVEKARLDKVMQNAEIGAMITAFGTGIGDDFNYEKLRYHKIILMSDADVDGSHIATLLLTFFFRYMKQLIENGNVYIACPPLYRIKWQNKEDEYVFSDAERDAALEKGFAEGGKLPKDSGVQRYKGLGEMNYDELWDTTMNPKTRSLIQVKINDAQKADSIFSILMGDDVASRKNFIQTNAKDVRFLDI